jgi:hypothetical protein
MFKIRNLWPSGNLRIITPFLMLFIVGSWTLDVGSWTFSVCHREFFRSSFHWALKVECWMLGVIRFRLRYFPFPQKFHFLRPGPVFDQA